MKRDRAAGFTLVELLTVVAVIAILVAVAYPSYQDYVRKGKRAEGKAALLRAAQQLERWYSDKATYATLPLNVPPDKLAQLDLAPLFGRNPGETVYSGENPADVTSPYKLTIEPEVPLTCPKEACYLITATPNDPYTDPTCGNFTLTSTGTRSWSNSSTPSTASNCKW